MKSIYQYTYRGTHPKITAEDESNEFYALSPCQNPYIKELQHSVLCFKLVHLRHTENSLKKLVKPNKGQINASVNTSQNFCLLRGAYVHMFVSPWHGWIKQQGKSLLIWEESIWIENLPMRSKWAFCGENYHMLCRKTCYWKATRTKGTLKA